MKRLESLTIKQEENYTQKQEHLLLLLRSDRYSDDYPKFNFGLIIFGVKKINNSVRFSRLVFFLNKLPKIGI